LRESAANRTVVIDLDKLRPELITGEPSGFFLGKRLAVGPIVGGIDCLELCDYIVDRELGEIHHLKIPWVSSEAVPASNTLSGNPFLFSDFLHPTLHKNSELHQAESSDSSRSIKTGGVALRSFSGA
jgi:hypothetical protein